MNIEKALSTLKVLDLPITKLRQLGITLNGFENNSEALTAIQCIYEYTESDVNKKWDIDIDDRDFFAPRKCENESWSDEEDDEIKNLFLHCRFKYGYLLALGKKFNRSPKSIADRFVFFCKHFGLDEHPF